MTKKNSKNDKDEKKTPKVQVPKAIATQIAELEKLCYDSTKPAAERSDVEEKAHELAESWRAFIMEKARARMG